MTWLGQQEANLTAQKTNANLYVATTGYFQSYSITSNHSLEYQSNVSLSSNCKIPIYNMIQSLWY